MVSEPPRPSVVMSLVSCATPWKPATIGMAPSSMAWRMRPGVTSMMRAAPWAESVIRPAWEPVYDRASAPRSEIAMATSAMEMRSPAVSSMSSSRAGGQRRHLLGEVEELVRGVAHRGHDDDDIVAGLLGVDDPARHALDAGGVSDAGAAVLLDDESHGQDSTDPRRTRLPRPVCERTRPVAAQTRRRPSKARPSVTSSAYSRSPPTGSPLASRETATPSGPIMRAR